MTLEFVSNVSARPVFHGLALFAARPLREGDTVFLLDGDIVDWPSRHSLQIGEDQHLLVPVADPLSEETGRYLWVYMNHHCRPNVWVCGGEMRALRDIAPGEELFFNYDTTEWDMATPFHCHCGAPDCLGSIRGFKYLSPARRAELLPYIPPYLKKRFDER